MTLWRLLWHNPASDTRTRELFWCSRCEGYRLHEWVTNSTKHRKVWRCIECKKEL